MDPAAQGSAAVARDNAVVAAGGDPMYHALALEHYLDPAKLDPSNLGEIEHALRELRKICGLAAAKAA